jgi:hypothetical protein
LCEKGFVFIVTLLLMSFCWIFIFGKSSAISSASQIEVLDVIPAPNYPLCTDDRDKNDLTDGVTVNYPIWVKRECVGWSQRGPVRIRVKVLVGESNTGFSGTISLHTAKGAYAGVDVPARVDVYGRLGAGKYHYAGGESLEKRSFNDRQSHWLHVKVSSYSPQMILIVRPRGNYFFIDEIRWSAHSPASGFNSAVVGDLLACESDSMERHRRSLLSRIRPEKGLAEKWVKHFGNLGVVTWSVRNPFTTLQPFPSVESIRKSKVALDLLGSRSESESGCIGILSTGAKEITIRVTVSGKPEIIRWVRLSQVQPILSADGKMVYDPLIPLDSGALINVQGRQAAYLWVQADLHKIPFGRHKVVVNLQDTATGWTGMYPVFITAAPIQLQSTRRPAAVNWAYTSDRPIWQDRNSVLSDLVDHGVNFFVLHPSIIPQPSLKDEWDLQTAQRFVKDITFFKGHGVILLYLGWGRGQKTGWLNLNHKRGSVQQKAAVQQWIRKIRTLLESLSISPSEWALYPVDEPMGKDLRFLREVAAWVKEADPAVQIYANPISTSSVQTSQKDLVALDSLIDFWQPSLRFAAKEGEAFFSGLMRPWWIYENAPMPAKSASPWKSYRLLSWRAWAIGAAGVGFWSYSDTSGTSAWDDLDGRRPDYAVVYEAREDGATPVSSRRWEAFREGIEDYQLLESALRGDLSSSSRLATGLRERVKQILRQANPPFDHVETLRRELLGVASK